MIDGDDGGKFRVVYPEAVRREVKELGISLGPLEKRAAFLAAVAAIDKKLSDSPQEFGEPIFDLKISGGQVRVAVVKPLTVRFAVYPKRKLVLVRWIRLLPKH